MDNINTVFDCSLIYLPKINATSGAISVIDNAEKNMPFEVNRVFYIYDVPAGENRGAHAHKACHQFVIAASGAFEVMLFDGNVYRAIQLNQPFMGLHIPPGIWASEQNFSSGSICLVLASHKYDEKDYIRNIDKFEKFKKI